jgi:hypothetical protein
MVWVEEHDKKRLDKVMVAWTNFVLSLRNGSKITFQFIVSKLIFILGIVFVGLGLFLWKLILGGSKEKK